MVKLKILQVIEKIVHLTYQVLMLQIQLSTLLRGV